MVRDCYAHADDNSRVLNFVLTRLCAFAYGDMCIGLGLVDVEGTAVDEAEWMLAFDSELRLSSSTSIDLRICTKLSDRGNSMLMRRRKGMLSEKREI